jgi:hypothetical protein
MAIVAASNNGGGVIRFQPGKVHAIHDPLILTSYVRLEMPPGVRLKWTGGANGIMITSSQAAPLQRAGVVGYPPVLDANGLAGFCLDLVAPSFCEFGGLQLINPQAASNLTTVRRIQSNAQAPSTDSTSTRGAVSLNAICSHYHDLVVIPVVRGQPVPQTFVHLEGYTNAVITDNTFSRLFGYTSKYGIRLVSLADNNYFEQVDLGITSTDTGAANVLLNDSSTGQIESLVSVSGGTGYTSAPTVTITDGGAMGGGAQAYALVSGNQVTNLFVTNKGSNYMSPIVSFSGGGGSGASFTAGVGGPSVDVDIQGNSFHDLSITNFSTTTDSVPRGVVFNQSEDTVILGLEVDADFRGNEVVKNSTYTGSQFINKSTHGGDQVISSGAAGVAANGLTQGLAAALLSDNNEVHAPDNNNTGVRLPPATAGMRITVFVPSSSVAPIAVFPASGGVIVPKIMNMPYNVQPAQNAMFFAVNSTTWYAMVTPQ